MKRIFLLTLVFLLFIPSHVFGARKVTSSQAQERKKGRFQSEVELWKKGLAAAKKRHWHRKQLTAQESSAYKSVLKRVGLTALLALIGAGAYAKRRYDRNEAMLLAATFGNVDRLQELLEGGFNPNEELMDVETRITAHASGFRATPLYQAVVAAPTRPDHSTAIVRELIRAGATIPPNLFLYVVRGGLAYPDLVQLLVEEGAPMDATDSGGDTALHIAIQNLVRPNLVKVLIDERAPLNATNNEGNTALHLATRVRRPDLVEVLVDERADQAITDGEGKTAKEIALEMQGEFDDEIIQQIIGILSTPAKAARKKG